MTNPQFGAALFDDPVLPPVGVGEEGDMVARVPIDGVHHEIKVVGCLVEEVVERTEDLEAVLLRGGIPERECAREEVVLHVYHEEGGRRGRQDGLDPLLVFCLLKEPISN